MGKIPKGGDITVRMVSEQCTVLVEKEQVGKFISDRIGSGWQVQGTQDASGYPGGEDEVEVRLSRQHDVNAPAVGNGK